MIKNVVVIGSGSLGTAIAQIISLNVEEVYLYARRKEVAEKIIETKVNSEYYPTIKLSDNIRPIHDFSSNFNPDVIFLCVPSSAVREISKNIENKINIKDSIVVSTSKGIEYPSKRTMSNVIFEEMKKNPVIFSGPTFASEIILNLPTVVNIASKNDRELSIIKSILTTDNFLVESTNDVIGTEMCSILKNINAIAYGICEGMNINDNAKNAVLTKGFHEMKEIVVKCGGNSITVDKYCGLGDLILTSTSKKSRNYTLGMLYGKRIIIDEMSSGILVEGKKSTLAIRDICRQFNIDSIITNFVFDIVINQESPLKAFEDLWSKMI